MSFFASTKMKDPKPPKRICDGVALALAKLACRECALCGSTDVLHVHHILFRSQGGDDVDANLCCLCLYCHEAIHARRQSAWSTLSRYVFSSREDTLLYLEDRLGSMERALSYLRMR